LTEVVTAALGGHRAALAPQQRSGWELGLGKQIIRESKSRFEQFAAPGGAIFWQIRGGQDKIGFRDELLECIQFCAIRWHELTIRAQNMKSKRSLFSFNAHFRHYQ
jgi:hypothetical protein